MFIKQSIRKLILNKSYSKLKDRFYKKSIKILSLNYSYLYNNISYNTSYYNKSENLINQQKQKKSMIQITSATQQEALEFFKEKYSPKQRKIYAFYNSEFNKVIINHHLMLIPIDDRMATRAHGVFDVIYFKRGKLINIESHIDRILKSAETVGIEINLSKDDIKAIIIGTVKIAINVAKDNNHQSQQNFKNSLIMGVRISISSGYGDFGIASLGKKPVLYVTVFEPYINFEKEKQGVNQFVVKIVPGINKTLVHTKTVNYIQNALMANQSKKKGGYMGIKALQNGVILEAAVANVAFVFNGQFATPRLETVIQGTTLKKLLVYLEQLKVKQIISKISFRDITIEQVQQHADQMIVIGGDKIVPVLNFNGKNISQVKGKITTLCQQWYQKQIEKQSSIIL